MFSFLLGFIVGFIAYPFIKDEVVSIKNKIMQSINK